MKSFKSQSSARAVLAALLLFPPLMRSASPTQPPETEKDKSEETVILSPFCVSGSSLGVTVGGAKDANYFRDGIERGLFPHPNTITAEGLFSEYDLPLKERNQGKDLLILNGEAIPAKLLTLPAAQYLAQIGFSSGLDAKTWKREPINLIAVIDKSGSMTGEPLDLVKRCLRKVLSQFGPEDQLSIVLYGDRSYVHLEPTSTTRANRHQIEAAIEEIQTRGSTNMEEGLKVGFDLARQSQKSFHGLTRLMQFTDERPNVGDTTAEGFMGLMEAGSKDGIGQTTIGVGEEFGAELATKVSSVRGGNLFYFSDRKEMEKTFTEQLDTLVTEVGYDLEVKICPAQGLRVAGVYGVPGAGLSWEGERTVRFQVSTLFLSQRRGAIYVAFAPEPEDLPARDFSPTHSLASVRLSYLPVKQDHPISSELSLPLTTIKEASPGLTRGRYLVNEYLGLKRALTAHLIENDQEKAYATLEDLQRELHANPERIFDREEKMVDQLTLAMSKLSGHGEDVANVESDLPAYRPDPHTD